jgi:hypothetical protein
MAWTSLRTADGLPQVRSRPSVSSFVRTPCSKHSIAKEIVAPVEMVSRPYSLHQWLIAIIASTSLEPVMRPKAPIVSYSGRWVCFGKANSPRSLPSRDSAPQATGQCQQAYFFSMRSLTLLPVIPDISALPRNSTIPTPRQFLTGASPEIAATGVMPVVPAVRKNSRERELKPLSESWTVLMTSRVWAITFFEGWTATALRSFEPMTAPTPERAARRPRSLVMPAMIERPSPAGPMRAMLVGRLPEASWRSALRRSSHSMASMPQ